MSIRSSLIIVLLSSIVFFILGLLLNDIPYFVCENRIRPFEALTFFVVLLFGYWFQRNQRISNHNQLNGQKLIESIVSEISCEVNKIEELIESSGTSDLLCDDIKKRIHLKFKSISINTTFVQKRVNSSNELTEMLISLKESVITEEFSTKTFVVSLSYFKEISAKSIDFKNLLRECVYKTTNA